jgi:hypothetical protein
METMRGQDAKATLNPKDRHLALLAVQAADEIDELRSSGNPSGLGSVKSLAELLTQTFSARREVDSGAVALFYHALGDSQWGGETGTVGDLVARVKEVADGLETASVTTEDVRLERVRVFCLALANAVIGYRRPYSDSDWS